MRKRGSGGISSQGYMVLSVEKKRKYEHIVVAEKALGKPLPVGVVVHHVNEIRTDNRRANLVICKHGYHKLLHRRMKARAATGDPNSRKCAYCKTWDDPKNLVIRDRVVYHRVCETAYQRKTWKRKI
jgi:hypothetical protein